MYACRDLFSNLISKRFLTLLLCLPLVISIVFAVAAKAEPDDGVAKLNVPGRYVSGKEAASKDSPERARGKVTGRYVTEGKGSATNGKVTTTAPAASASDMSSTSVTSNASGPLQRALDELPKLYGKRIAKEDIRALKAYYANHSGTLLWVDKSGLTPRGKAVLDELSKADDWGLSRAAFDLPEALGANATAEDQARTDIRISLSVLKYVRFARGGRVNPRSISRFFDQKPQLVSPDKILPKIAAARAPDAYLRGQHPTHPQFAKLKKALFELRHPKKEKIKPAKPTKAAEKIVRLPDGPTLRPGMSHPNVAKLRERLKVTTAGENENIFDETLRHALEKFQSENGLSADGIMGPVTRRVLNGDKKKRKKKPASKEARIQKIVINMERWRWMPREPGSFYIWNNIPEFRTRIYKDGEPIYSEKIIVGKNKNPTPAFSADMKLVVFHPSWGVPNGIKKTEILPYLKQTSGFFGWGGADTRILKRHNLRVSQNGRPVDASKINWSKVDIRKYDFIQPPSKTNVLGRVKFRFPNRHDVYMHDTPERHLFKNARRTFSHGCIRVLNPRRLAEVILKHDKGWGSEKVGQYWKRGGTVKLDTHFPVHTAYFTAVADEDGKIKTVSDVYGYDGRLARALGERPMRFEADNATTATSRDEQRSAQRRKPKKKQKSKEPETVADIFSSVFSP